MTFASHRCPKRNCDARFADRRDLDRHTVTCTGGPTPLPHIGGGDTDVPPLQAHRFVCTVCGNGYAAPGALYGCQERHERQRHIARRLARRTERTPDAATN